MTLVFATHNENKLKEVKKLLPKHITLLSLTAIGCVESIPETQNTIEGNALQKARFIKTHYGYDCFADDTGLEVKALNGAPGVFSARYAGKDATAENNMTKLLHELEAKSMRCAQFKTVIALISNGKETLFTGVCKGEITTKKQGENGFGYDPIFLPKGYSQTFAEMDLVLKNKIGHRGKAVNALVEFLENKKF